MDEKHYKNIEGPHDINLDIDKKPKSKIKRDLKKPTSEKNTFHIPQKVTKNKEPNISIKTPVSQKTITKSPVKSKNKSILKTIGIIVVTIILSLSVIYIVVNFDALRAKATFTRNNVDIIEYSDGQQRINLEAFSDGKNSLIFVPVVLGFPDPEVVEFPEEEKEEVEETSEESIASIGGGYSVENTLNNQLFIPSLGISAPVVWDSSVDEASMLASLQSGVAHYLGTAKPGEGLAENTGNVFISGHSSYYSWDPGGYKSIFATLPNINIGDQIAIGYYDKVYVYEVYDKTEVAPENVDVVRQDTSEHIVTLMTCVPIGTNERRLIVRARFIGYAE